MEVVPPRYSSMASRGCRAGRMMVIAHSPSTVWALAAMLGTGATARHLTLVARAASTCCCVQSAGQPLLCSLTTGRSSTATWASAHCCRRMLPVAGRPPSCISCCMFASGARTWTCASAWPVPAPTLCGFTSCSCTPARAVSNRNQVRSTRLASVARALSARPSRTVRSMRCSGCAM
jgi:hypothetical protein